ncbi:MAG: ribonuclease HI [Deltaproteobacteria bacterium]|nr:MAG: ribonuclease HI [Deltaproteobacteria bacterium]
MPWKRYLFKGDEVYVRVMPDGKPMVRGGRVELRYRLGARKSYRGSVENLEDVDGEIVDDEAMGGAAPSARAAPKTTPSKPADDETIVIYSDGACLGNPGPAGIGVYAEYPDEIVEYAEYLGETTNNFAELSAILRALERVPEADRSRPVHLYTDSAWSLGVLVQGWKAKTHLDLIRRIQELAGTFSDLELLKIRGHAGHHGNEEADRLANIAVRREDGFERRRPRRRTSGA